MKNRWIVFLLTVLLAACMTGCDKADGGDSLVMQEEEAVVNVQEESISSTGLVLVIRNDTDDLAYQFGNAYSLEKFVDDRWIAVEQIRDVAVTAIAHMLLPGETIELPVKWENRYGNLPTGAYRIVKRIEIVQDDGDDNYKLIDDYHMYVSFSL